MTTRETIESAFADVPYPGNDNITRCTYEDCLECEEIAAYFRGTTWHDHTLDKLQNHQSAISMFTPDALHYFIPAFMLQSLGHWIEADMIPHSIAFLFAPESNTNADMQQYYAERWSIFSQQQRKAIAVFLREYLVSDSEPWFAEDVGQAISRLETHDPAV